LTFSLLNDYFLGMTIFHVCSASKKNGRSLPGSLFSRPSPTACKQAFGVSIRQPADPFQAAHAGP